MSNKMIDGSAAVPEVNSPEAERPTLGVLRSGERVVDRFNSHAVSHPVDAAVLVEALSRVDSQGRIMVDDEIVFDRTVGNSICVATSPGDRIVYARRPKRAGLTRFVRNRQTEPSRSVVVILKRMEEPNSYVLISAYVGNKAALESWDPNLLRKPDPHAATAASLKFWANHALVWGSVPVLRGSETTRKE